MTGADRPPSPFKLRRGELTEAPLIFVSMDFKGVAGADFVNMRHIAQMLNSFEHGSSGQERKQRHQQCHRKSRGEILNDEQNHKAPHPFAVKQPSASIVDASGSKDSRAEKRDANALFQASA